MSDRGNVLLRFVILVFYIRNSTQAVTIERIKITIIKLNSILYLSGLSFWIYIKVPKSLNVQS